MEVGGQDLGNADRDEMQIGMAPGGLGGRGVECASNHFLLGHLPTFTHAKEVGVSPWPSLTPPQMPP